VTPCMADLDVQCELSMDASGLCSVNSTGAVVDAPITRQKPCNFVSK
jgi:hypothetical protein